MSEQIKAQFFDGIASKWDGWEDLPVLQKKLAEGYENMEIKPDETILDVGCGTGNLTISLLSILGTGGRVVAVDISKAMIEKAKAKVNDNRITWHISNAGSIPEPDGTFDRIICYSVWPHFDDIDLIIQEFVRLIRPQGFLHVWHLNSKETINQIHENAGDAVCKDVLVPAQETAMHLRQHGFEILEIVDNDQKYLVTARKTAGKESLF